jgi:YVTN family beta-propeller protein
MPRATSGNLSPKQARRFVIPARIRVGSHSFHADKREASLKKWLILCACVLVTIGATFAAAGYRLLRTIPVGGAGSWDYLTVDEIGQRLFVSHETQVEVIDLASNRVNGKITDTPGVHGIALAEDAGHGFISNGQASTVAIFDLKTLAPISQVPTGKKPDAIVYDPSTHRVFAMNGGSDSATVIDAVSGKVVGTIALGGGPEFAAADGLGNVFVNLEDQNATLRLDAREMTAKNRWPLAPCERPSSMAIDRAQHRLFIGCRSKVMAVVDSDTGSVIVTLPIGEHVDASAFDPATGLIFNSTGEGTVDVFHEDSPDKYTAVQRIPTHPGSKTMALNSKTHELLVPSNASGTFQIQLFGK